MTIGDKEVVLAILASLTQIAILLINTKYTVEASRNTERNGRRLKELDRAVQDSISTPFLSHYEREALKKEHERDQKREPEGDQGRRSDI